jgi:hypothetical protein
MTPHSAFLASGVVCASGLVSVVGLVVLPVPGLISPGAVAG